MRAKGLRGPQVCCELEFARLQRGLPTRRRGPVSPPMLNSKDSISRTKFGMSRIFDHIPDEKRAAVVVQGWIDSQQRQLTAEEIAKLSPGERLDYARRFDQTKMPEWRDPRKPNR